MNLMDEQVGDRVGERMDECERVRVRVLGC